VIRGITGLTVRQWLKPFFDSINPTAASALLLARSQMCRYFPSAVW